MLKRCQKYVVIILTLKKNLISNTRTFALCFCKCFWQLNIDSWTNQTGNAAVAAGWSWRPPCLELFDCGCGCGSPSCTSLHSSWPWGPGVSWGFQWGGPGPGSESSDAYDPHMSGPELAALLVTLLSRALVLENAITSLKCS